MSGANIPYHLRLHKHVDRALFIELCGHIARAHGVTSSTYAYVSMAGRHLVDLNMAHTTLRINKLFSIDSDRSTVKRQLFNRRYGCIDCKEMTSTDLVQDLSDFVHQNRIKRLVLWLDYTDPSALRTQLDDVNKACAQLCSGDILKVTINAALGSLAERRFREESEEYSVRQRRTLLERLDSYAPAAARTDSIDKNTLLTMYAQALQSAVERGLASNPKDLDHVLASAFVYEDGQRMATFTVSIVDDGARVMHRRNLRSGWPFVPNSWADVKAIKVPMLSQREREAIESRLYRYSPRKIARSLPFPLDGNLDEATRQIIAFRDYHHFFPAFVSAVVV